MTDEELLEKWRGRYPNIPLSMARKLEIGARRYSNWMTPPEEAERREQAARKEQQQRLRDLVNRKSAGDAERNDSGGPQGQRRGDKGVTPRVTDEGRVPPLRVTDRYAGGKVPGKSDG